MAIIETFNFISKGNELSPSLTLDRSYDSEHEVKLEKENKLKNLLNDFTTKIL